jgi:ComF family protein
MHLSIFVRRMSARYARSLVDIVLPPLCPGCDDELQGVRWICSDCRRRFREMSSRPLCLACRLGERKAKGREAGLACSVREHAAWWGGAAFWMEPPLDRVVHRMKYGGCPALARPLGRLIARQIPAPEAAGIAAVPLFRSRRRERGYNQAELLSRELAGIWGVPHVAGLLGRKRSTHAQARLGEEHRRKNVSGAFSVLEPSWVVGRTWMVVDDVVTTGSTLFECVEALRREGAAGVVPVVLALA